MESETVFIKDFDSKSLYIMKILRADISKVWNYFTKSELLDLWWAPEPWKCETLSIDFKENGVWHYALKSPEGKKIFSSVTFDEIMQHRSFGSTTAFCDENGTADRDFPPTQWLTGFTGIEEGTKVTFNLHFESEEALRKQLEIGFEKSFETALGRLEHILNSSPDISLKQTGEL